MRPDPAPGPQGRSEVKASRTVSGDRAVPRPEIALPGDPARGVVLQGIVVAAVLTVTLLLAWHPLEDLDIWFHLRAGTDQLAHGPLPAVNQYSFTEPRHPWLNHEWLFQALVHATAPHDALPSVDAAGWNLLRTALAGLLALLLVLGDGGLARLRGRADGTAAPGTGLVLLAALGLLWPRLMLRPELLSYIAIVLLVRWTEGLGTEVARDGLGALRPRRWLDPRTRAGRVWWLVLIWAQAHGFSSVAPLIVGIGLVGGAADGRLRRPTRAAWRAAGFGVLAMLVALLATPNGWQGLVFPLRAIGQFRGADADLRRTVAELTPLLASPDALHATILLFKASLIAGVLLGVTGWRRLGLLRLVLWAATAAAAFATQRALGPYAVAFALLGLRYAPSLPQVSVPLARLSARARLAWALGVATVMVAGAGLWVQGIVSDGFYLAEGVARRYGDGLAPAQYPLIAAGRLAGQPPSRVFANLGASGLLLGTTRAELYIDGRTEAYSPALWREYLEIKRGGDQALALLDARHVDRVCLAGPGGAFATLARDLLASHRWQLESAEGAGLLLRRESLSPGPDAAPLQEAAKRSELVRAARAQEQEARDGRLSAARAADALLAAATLHGLAGDTGSQRTCLEQAAQRAPRHALAQHNLGNQLLAEGRFDLALERFRAAAAANRRLGGPRLNAGVCLMRLNRPAEAARWFEQATRLDSRGFEAWANLAVARNAAGDRAGALSAIDRALVLSPANARLTGLRDSLRRSGSAQ